MLIVKIWTIYSSAWLIFIMMVLGRLKKVQVLNMCRFQMLYLDAQRAMYSFLRRIGWYQVKQTTGTSSRYCSNICCILCFANTNSPALVPGTRYPTFVHGSLHNRNSPIKMLRHAGPFIRIVFLQINRYYICAHQIIGGMLISRRRLERR